MHSEAGDPLGLTHRARELSRFLGSQTARINLLQLHGRSQCSAAPPMTACCMSDHHCQRLHVTGKHIGQTHR